MFYTPVRRKLRNITKNVSGNSWIQTDISYDQNKLEIMRELARLKSRPADVFPKKVKEELENNWHIVQLQRQHHLTG